MAYIFFFLSTAFFLGHGLVPHQHDGYENSMSWEEGSFGFWQQIFSANLGQNHLEHILPAGSEEDDIAVSVHLRVALSAHFGGFISLPEIKTQIIPALRIVNFVGKGYSLSSSPLRAPPTSKA